jgi:hypothetical protein
VESAVSGRTWGAKAFATIRPMRFRSMTMMIRVSAPVQARSMEACACRPAAWVYWVYTNTGRAIIRSLKRS